MKCPHCTVSIYVEDDDYVIAEDVKGLWKIGYNLCPNCDRIIVYIVNGKDIRSEGNSDTIVDVVGERTILYPRSISRPQCPAEVPVKIAEDYNEACLVLADSSKASAALSRRCLQHFLREVVGVRPSDLSNEIQQVIDSGKLPSYIAEAIDAIRNIGNFAAHPQKSQQSGEILPVEPAEAEWNLEVLEALFDFYCVQPAIARKKKEALNRKLQEAGKHPMK